MKYQIVFEFDADEQRARNLLDAMAGPKSPLFDFPDLGVIVLLNRINKDQSAIGEFSGVGSITGVRSISSGDVEGQKP